MQGDAAFDRLAQSIAVQSKKQGNHPILRGSQTNQVSENTNIQSECEKHPRLPPDVPSNLRRCDEELVEIGRIKNSYERHFEAQYAFTKGGTVSHAYKHLWDAVDHYGR